MPSKVRLAEDAVVIRKGQIARHTLDKEEISLPHVGKSSRIAA